MKEENSTLDDHSEQDKLAERSSKADLVCKQESEAVDEMTNGNRSSCDASQLCGSERWRPKPSLQSCPPQPPIESADHERGSEKRHLKEILGDHEELLEDVLLKVVGFEESEEGEKSHEKGELGSVATGFLQAMVEDCVKTTLDGQVEKLLEQNKALKVENKRMKDAMQRVEIQMEVADQAVTTAMEELEERGS